MKILLRFIGYGFLTVSLAGCSLLHRTTGVHTAKGVASLPLYSGPKVRIAVADFEVKAAKATGEIGLGVREMLIAALSSNNRFSIVERQQAQTTAIKEQGLSASGESQAGKSGAQNGATKSADLVITASVSEFEPQVSGGRAGVGGAGGVSSGAFGGLLGTPLNKAHMALDISIVDTSTAKALAATRVQGQASDTAGLVKGRTFGSWGLGAGLSAYADTPMEKAIRICIIEAVRYMSQSIPVSYYKY